MNETTSGKLLPFDLRATDCGVDMPERELHLYTRYVRVLALLCECAPYVEEEDYRDLIDEVLVDACRHYPLQFSPDGERRELAPRVPPEAGTRAVLQPGAPPPRSAS